MTLTTCDPASLKAQVLICLQLVEASSPERTPWRRGSMRDVKAQKARGCWVSLGSVTFSGEGCEERVYFWKI
jgi:hypothetical protein